MKKYIYILAVALLGAVACTEEFGPEVDMGNGYPEGAKVEVSFSVPVPAETRALTYNPDVSRMIVLVFNDNTLIETAEAELGGTISQNATVTGDTEGNVTSATPSVTYSVQLTMTSSTRILNFVGLSEGTELSIPSSGSEVDVMRALTTSGGNSAYWHRVVLSSEDGGISAYTYAGGTPKYPQDASGNYTNEFFVTGDSYVDHNGQTVNVGDYINKNGDKITDATGYFASEKVQETVKYVPLIKNYVSLKLRSTWSVFTLRKAALVNVPSSGYVAPIDGSTFVSAYMNDKGITPLTLNDVEGYSAPVPGNELTQDCPTDFATVDGDGYVNLFMYERGLPTTDPVCVLVAGVLQGASAANMDSDGNTWIKLEVSDAGTGSYIPLYRNFTYNMNFAGITGISVANIGYSSPEAAFNAASIGDISGSAETQTLTQITDGTYTMWVEYIDYTHVGDATTATLLYKFFKNTDETDSEGATAGVTLTVSTPSGISAAITSTTVTGSSYSGNGPDGKTGWYQVEVPLAATEATIKRSTIRVSGTYDLGNSSKILYRDVTYRVMNKQTFQNVSLTDAAETPATISSVPTSEGDEFYVKFTLPENLGYSIFPLNVYIEDKDGNINPAENNIPVKSGPSAFSGVTTNAFFFVKIINYTDYLAGRDYSVKFKISKTTTTTNQIAISDENGYFNVSYIPAS